ncbi:MAG: glycosyltransferase family 4 protein [Candidatus Korobacteraceae bacterium]
MNSQRVEFAACTIIAKNYLPMARVLSDSWRKFHPDCPMFVLFLDSPQGFFRPEDEPFCSVFASDLQIRNLPGFLFKYSILEASTAVKPYLLNYLFRQYSVDKLLYLDPDILIFESLHNLRETLEDANLLLTPHLLSPLPPDGCGQDEHEILQAGTYNLGFLGIRNSLESRRFLRWWSEKLYHQCIVSFENNLFVDQRWVDMVPGLFEGVQVVRDPAYNIAYWNLHERAISLDDGVQVNGRPLRFFHFSGFNPDKPSTISKYQNRYEMANVGQTRKLYNLYRDLLIESGWDECKDWTYSHNFFANGVKIPAEARRYYWGLGPDVDHLGNPFTWLKHIKEPPVPRFDLDRSSDLAPGVNLLGYFESEKGVGEGVRSNLRIIQATGLPYVLNNWVDSGSSNVESVSGKLDTNNPYVINLMTLNADGLQAFGRNHSDYLTGHYNIGYWAWELSDFPPEWDTSFGYADEIWTPSKFTSESVAHCSPVPVRVVPHALVSTDFDATPDRAAFGLDPNVFLFLFLFDFHSFLQRKNPLGLIRSYKKAFGNRKDVQLLIKSSHSAQHKDELALLQDAVSGTNVKILDTVLTREAKQQLMKTADCYVSLHRSEGFGLTLAEAMMCGKPVIATAYSGNVDFMSDSDSFLVPYRMVAIDRTHGPYKAGYQWADPDLDYAVDFMRYVESHREAAASLGLRAKAKVSDILNPATIGAAVRQRLEALGLAERVDQPHAMLINDR